MKTCIGIDVGGVRKGFHAVAMRGRAFEPFSSTHLDELLEWIEAQQASVIAIDSPCAWSLDGGSRECERSLCIHGERIHCFSTPTRERASGRAFYDWVRNGLRLYAALQPSHSLYDGGRVHQPAVCETFPQAVACMLAGRKVSAHHKSEIRRQVLCDAGHRHDGLSKIDEVDAALCAIAAKALLNGSFEKFGRPREGYIITPKP